MQAHSSKLTSSVTPGCLSLSDSHVPPFKTGRYQFTATSQISSAEEKALPDLDAIQHDHPPMTQTIIINGPHFSIPAEDIHAMYPPSNSVSRYDLHLPHIIFNVPELPWENDPGVAKEDKSAPNPTVPWMALLLLTESELVGGPNAATAETLAWSQLQSVDPQQIRPHLALDPPPSDDTAISTLCLPVPLARAILPSFGEMQLLSHQRDINVADDTDLGDCEQGQYSVIVGSRFPEASTQANSPVKHTVHLVSLEGIDLDLLKNSATPLAQTSVRLISLLHWSFQCSQEQTESFNQLAAQAIQGDLSLRLSQGQRFKPYIDRGLVALEHSLRSGDNTATWFRGPLSPVPVPELPFKELLNRFSNTGEGLMIYIPSLGMFDTTYSAAWQLGWLTMNGCDEAKKALIQYRTQHKECKKLSHLTAVCTHQPLHKTSDFKSIIAEGIKREAWHKFDCSKRYDPQPYHQLKYQRRLLVAQKAQSDAWEKLKAILLNWCQLSLVPFNYMVPDERLLPMETLRFFYVDQIWIRCFLLGALCVHDCGQQQDINLSIIDQLSNECKEDLPVWGFLFRSTLITAYPKLTIAFESEKDFPAKLLVNKRLSSSLTLGLFNNKPSSVTWSEPHEHLGYGATGDHLQASTLPLRQLSGDKTGQIIQGQSLNASDYLSQMQVIDLWKLHDTLGQHKNPGESVTSTDIALTLTRAAQAVKVSIDSPAATRTLSVQ